jgi:hypothetical protein
LELWKKEVEQIRQATRLPIEVKSCPEHDWEQLLAQYEADGYEIVQHLRVHGEILHVVIPKKSWPASARALLALLLTKPEQITPLHDQLTGWLQGVLSGAETPLPKQIETRFTWREKRACFLLERTRAESICRSEMWQQLLQDFFPAAGVMLLPLTPVYLLLAVPLSALSEAEEPASLLELATSLHDLLSTETVDTVRVIAAPPIHQPAHLANALRDAVALSKALQRYRPRVMAAGTWQYPLERWADLLDPSVVNALRDGLRSILPAPSLTGEQLETLETFFSQQLNVSETARRLYLHRNTLLYRLDKLTEQTKLDPRQFSDAILLQLSLLFRQND